MKEAPESQPMTFREHQHVPQPGAVHRSRCTICGAVIIRGYADKPWRVKPKGHS